MTVYNLILEELTHRGCAYVDRYPPYYIASIGGHILNLANREFEFYIDKGGDIGDTRLHIIFAAPPGFSKTFWLNQFLPRGTGEGTSMHAIMKDTGVDVTMEASVTGAGFVGTIKFAGDGESVREPGLAELHSTALIGIEEFSAVTTMMKAAHSGELDNALLLALDSVTGDSRLFYKQNKKIIYDTMESLYNAYNKGYKLETLGLRGKSIDWDDVNAVEDHGLREVYKVELGDGKSIKSTEDHSFMTKKRKYLTSTYGATYEPCSFKDAKNLLSINIEIETDVDGPCPAEFTQLLGLWIADGSFGSYKSGRYYVVQLAAGDKLSNQKYVEDLGAIPTNEKGDYYIASKDLVDMMIECGVDPSWKSLTKRVPEWLFQASIRQITSFLRGYFSGDGSIFVDTHSHGKNITIVGSSSSRKLLSDIQTLLMRLGIASRIDSGYLSKLQKTAVIKSKHKNYHLLIERVKDVRDFLRKIGFMHDYGIDLKHPLLNKRHSESSVILPRQVRSITKLGIERVYDINTSSGTFVANGILLHNSGYVYKRLAAGPIRYHTNVTLHTGSQPLRFDLSSGLARRFMFLEFMPKLEDFIRLRQARRQSIGKRHSPLRTKRIRQEIKVLRKKVEQIKRIEIDQKFYEFIDVQGETEGFRNVWHTQEVLLERFLLGLSCMRNKFKPSGYTKNAILDVEFDDVARDLCSRLVRWHYNVMRGSQYSQIMIILEDLGGHAPRAVVRDRLLDYGVDYSQASDLIQTMVTRLKMIVERNSILYLPEVWSQLRKQKSVV